MVLNEGDMDSLVLLCEASAHLVDALVFLVLQLVAGKEKVAILSSPLALDWVTAQIHQVQGVGQTLKVILLEFEPNFQPPPNLLGSIYVHSFHLKVLQLYLINSSKAF